MGPAESDLERWIPRLLAAWRALRRDLPRDGRRDARRGPRPPHDQLLPDELREVSAAVQRLSVGLTRDRKLAGARYLDDDRLLGAYLLFYWPVSYLQARGVLSELPRRPRSALDLGSGPAPVAFAALDAGAAEVLAADRSTRALAVARTLAVEAGEPIAVREWDPQRRGDLAGLSRGRSFDLVTLGHVVNEIFQGEGAAVRRAALLEETLGLVAPGGSLVVIEPALRDTSRALLEVRDLLVARGVAVRAPCLFRGACPALVRPTDWCHAERPIDPPPLVVEIGRRAGLRKESVKMSYLVLAPRGRGGATRAPGASSASCRSRCRRRGGCATWAAGRRGAWGSRCRRRTSRPGTGPSRSCCGATSWRSPAWSRAATVSGCRRNRTSGWSRRPGGRCPDARIAFAAGGRRAAGFGSPSPQRWSSGAGRTSGEWRRARGETAGSGLGAPCGGAAPSGARTGWDGPGRRRLARACFVGTAGRRVPPPRPRRVRRRGASVGRRGPGAPDLLVAGGIQPRTPAPSGGSAATSALRGCAARAPRPLDRTTPPRRAAPGRARS